VQIIGDGTQTPDTINGDKLFNYDLLLETGTAAAKKHMDKNVESTRDDLCAKLYEL
jgi:hypothetical protein